MKKRQVVSLYWFAAQQQASAFRRQKIHPFYVKFRDKWNEFFRRLQKQQEKERCFWKVIFGKIFWKDIFAGVPLGSILGPLMFNIYNRNILNNFFFISTKMVL